MLLFEYTVDIENNGDIAALFGNLDGNIKTLEKAFDVSFSSHNGVLKIKGEEKNVGNCIKVVNSLFSFIKKGETITDQSLNYLISMVQDGKEKDVSILTESKTVFATAAGKPLKARTVGQQKYLDAITKNTLTIAEGPAGTGKTYLAVAMAVKAFKNKDVSRIILTRPAVEAGEKLGFLPGDLQQKIDPYLRPLYDALYEMLGSETLAKCQERGDIEVAPLAYMRGRTLDNSFIILDEAQNTTREQMKMFLTRLGSGSKIVVTGDITQIDLPSGKASGLRQVLSILKNVEDVSIIRLTGKDVVRHKLVQDIIKAYEKAEVKTVKNAKNGN